VLLSSEMVGMLLPFPLRQLWWIGWHCLKIFLSFIMSSNTLLRS
jgi:hypothetical protein